MWLWQVRIPTEDFTYVALASEDTDEHDDNNDLTYESSSESEIKSKGDFESDR